MFLKRREVLLGGVALFVAAKATAKPESEKLLILSGQVQTNSPPWVINSPNVPDIYFDWKLNRAWIKSTNTTVLATSLVTVVRSSSTDQWNDSAGKYWTFGANTARRTDLGLLSEEPRTNIVLWNRDLTNVAWTKSNVTAALDQFGIDNFANSASSLTATAANATALQAITSVSAARMQSVFLKRITGTGNIDMTMDNGVTWTTVSGSINSSSWTRVSIPTQTLANPTVGFRIVTSGDAVAVDAVQNETGASITSPILTTTVAKARAADVITLTSFPIFGSAYSLFSQSTPQSPNTYTSNQYAVMLSNATTTDRLAIDRTTTGLSAFLSVGSGSSNLNLTSSAWSANASGRAAIAFARGSQAGSFNGAAPVTGSGVFAVAAPTQLEFGCRLGTQQQNGPLEYTAVWFKQRVPNAQLQSMQPQQSWTASWNGNAATGDYTLAPGITSAVALTPNGNAPVIGDLSSFRYHHHTRIAKNGSRIWIMCSASGTNEDAGGQMVHAISSIDGGVTWSAPQIVCQNQGPWSGTGATDDPTSRIAWPRLMVAYGGTLYGCFAINSGDATLGLALGAAELKADGTIGNPFLISTQAYTAMSGIPTIDYDPILGPPLYAQADLYGVWGGSSAGPDVNAPWAGWLQTGGSGYTEPTTINRNGVLQRFWRRVSGSPMTVLSSQISTDGGANWLPILQSDIPNAPSMTGGIFLNDGRFCLVGNPVNHAGVSRNPLYLALFNNTTGLITSPYAVLQGLSPTPVYPGTNKGGAAQYAGVWEDGTDLLISCSRAKEDVYFARVPNYRSL